MATYVPNATQATEPVESRTVESAALEFRTLKTSINAEIAALEAEDLALHADDVALQAEIDAVEVRTLALEQLAFNGSTPGTVVVQRFVTNAVQTAFTLNVTPVTVAAVDAYINGIYQNHDTFSVSGNVVTFSEAPAAGVLELQVSVPLQIGVTTADAVSYTPSGTGAVATTVQSKLQESVSVKDFGASTTATAAANAAAINAAIQANLGGEIVITEAYSIDSPINLNGFSGTIRFSGSSASLNAGANNLKIFESTTNAYGCKITDPRINGTGFTGITAFDLTRFQLRGAEIVRPVMVDCEYGIYLRSLCWGLKIDHPETTNVTYPITLVEGCNAVLIDHPNIDTFGTVGIWIKTGGTYPNVGNMILNGFVQNGTEGIVDQGIQTQVVGTYFEGCTVADVSLKTSSGNFYGCATNHTATGAIAYRARSTDAAMIVHPFMSSGARTIGLFDFDGTNTNCYYDVIFGAGSRNLPIGVVTGIKNISSKPGPIGSVTPDTGAFTTLSTSGAATLAQATTNYNTQTIATATATTFFTAARGMYMVHAYVPFSGGPSAYTAQAVVLCDGSGARIIANNGSNLTITLSGLNVQVTQTSGNNQSVSVQALRIL